MFRQPTRRSAYVPQPHPCAWVSARTFAERFASCHHEWCPHEKFCINCGLQQKVVDLQPRGMTPLRFLMESIVEIRPCISLNGEIPVNGC